MKPKQKEISKAEFSKMQKLLKSLRIEEVRLSESHSALMAFNSQSPPEVARQTMNIQLGGNPDLKKVFAIVAFELNLTGVEVDSKPQASIAGKYLVTYGVEGEMPSSTGQDTIARSAIMTIYPYWREFVHSMCLRMNIPPTPVPMMHLDEVKNQLVKTKKKSTTSSNAPSQPSSRSD